MERRHQSGFTLIEILVVVAILGILSVAVVISVAGIPERGQRSACAGDRSALAAAFEAAVTNGVDLSTPSNDVSAALVSSGLLHSPSVYYAVSSTGDITLRDGVTKCS